MRTRRMDGKLMRTMCCLMLAAALAVALTGCRDKDGWNETVPAPTPGSGTEGGDGVESVIGNIPEGSILIFGDNENARKLISDMEAGKVPAECRAMYDESGARPEVVITDPEIITEFYNRVGHMIIGEESQESITDCYHYVMFTLQDGTTVGWSFEGTGLLVSGYSNYEVLESGGLWGRVREMQDEID